MGRIIAAVSLLSSVLLAEDAEVSQGYFKSENNLIEEIHAETAANKDFMVLKLKVKLTGKNSRSRVLFDKRSNYGDSVSSFAYVQISKDDQVKAEVIRTAHSNQINVDLVYTCGEQPDDKKRKVFPFYVETNCEVAAVTIKKPKEKRGSW